MGQATVDLPDPLDAPPPSSLSGTDDLLARLAGDEIDRLLAEADLEQKAPPEKPATPAVAVSPADSEANSTATAAAPAADVAVTPEAAASAAPTPAPTDAAASVPGAGDELDDLLSKLEEGGASSLPPATPAEPPAAPATAVAPESATPTAAESTSLVDRVPDILAQFPASDAVATTAAATTPAPTVDAAAPATQVAASPAVPAAPAATDASDGLMSAAERDALKISELADDSAHAEAAPGEDAGPGRLAPVIKVLEIVNAPVSFIPDRLRDTLGKVAIVTLVNSIAVLIYVLFLRH